jgi:hypothetical protein
MKGKTIIKIQGHLNGKWKECFEGMEISYEGNNTILTGNLKNEAHMYGVLNILRNYNLILILINPVKGKHDVLCTFLFKERNIISNKMKAFLRIQ